MMKHIVAILLTLVQVSSAASALVSRQRSLHLDVSGSSAQLRTDVHNNTLDDIDKPKVKNLPKATRDVPFPEKKWKTHLECNVGMVVNSASDKDTKCPMQCPFFVQDKQDDKHCSFQCVRAEQCAELNPKTPIADPNVQGRGQMVCRSPMVQFCKEYQMDGTDTCVKCNSGYYLGGDGQCHYKFMPVLIAVAVVLGLVAFAIGYWMVDLKTRPQLNISGLEDALAFRSRQKIHMPREGTESRKLFPLNTNMLRTSVAGPGLLLHFNFQFMVIIWASLVGFGWILLGLTCDWDLFVIGTRRFGTPRENCILVAWGYETQQELMWTKVLFLSCVYVGTFICTLLHSIRQLRIFQLMDEHTKTMKDFVAMVEGMPTVKGSEHVEHELKKAVMDQTGCDVVGTSVAWKFSEQKELCQKILEHEIGEGEKQALGAESQRAYDQYLEEMPPIRKQLYSLEQKAFCAEEFDTADAAPAKVKGMLEELETSCTAFVVFKTEKQRDIAVEKLSEKGLNFMGENLTMTCIYSEPDTIMWENFGASSWDQIMNLLKGMGAITLALALWTLVFYAPYAYSIYGFNYDNGQQPGPIYSISFTMVVVIGNAIMYEVCAQVSDGIGLRFKDDREATYMILYTVACLFNVFLDFFTTYFMALQISSELGFRTYHGRKIREIESFTKQFESYALQRILAENAFSYAFPSTFLVPFVLEPVITIIAPLMLAEWVVRSHPEIVGHTADMLLTSFPMELGRYADIILNILLGAIFFYFPGGATHILFLGMAVSHIWIYCFDHYKVLRAIPTCNFASMDVDWYSQAMCAPCTGLVLSCLVFKANCQGYGYCLDSYNLLAACTGAGILHTIVHLLCLIYIVPIFGKKEPEDHFDTVEYKEVAQKLACSWFNSNPINCLRSQHIYKHEPHCRYCFAGKEHLLVENPEIGCFFKDEAAEVEDFGVHATKGWGTLKKTMQAKGAFQSLAKKMKDQDAQEEP